MQRLSGKFQHVRIAILTTSYPSFEGHSAGHFVAAEAAALCRQGHDVVVFAPGDAGLRAGCDPCVVRIDGLGSFGPPGALTRLRQNPIRVLGGLWFAFRARRELTRRGPFDRIIAHWLVPCGWPIATGLPGRLEVVVHGSDLGVFGRLPARLRCQLSSTWLTRGVSFRCVSAALRAELLACAGQQLGPYVRVEANPLRLDVQPSRAQARFRLALEPGVRLVLVVARLIPGKRVRTALEAVSHLPAVQVVVVGGGPEEPQLRRAFPSVHFTGELPRPQALLWIAAADVLVSASRREGAPTAVREARALAVPVVACPAGDLTSWAKSDDGLWLASDDRSGEAAQEPPADASQHG